MSRPELLVLNRGEVDLVTGEGRVAGRPIALTESQRQLLRHLSRHVGTTVSRDDLEALLELRPGSRAVDVAVHRLRTRIEVDPAEPVHVQSVFGTGYRFEPALPQPRELLGVPEPRADLVGRERELAALSERAEEAGAVVVHGMSGVGKSALVVAAARAGRHPRVVFVDAEPLAIGDLWPALARVLGARADRNVESSVLDALRTGPRTLVVLDGAQRVADDVRQLVERVATQAPTTTVLISSTVPLGLDRPPFPVGPLSVDAARDLFRARSAALDSRSRVDSALLERLVDRLDRLPLAIELAAARARTMPVATLVQRLDEPLRVLVDPRAEVVRHRSLRAVLALSWSELTPEAREVLARLSVFRGPVETEVARAALDRGAELLPALVDASWLQTAGDGVRWLESTRAWAAEQADPALLLDARRRHAEAQADVVRRLRGTGPVRSEVLERLAERSPDLWAALGSAHLAPRAALEVARQLYLHVRSTESFEPMIAALGDLIGAVPADLEGIATLWRMRATCHALVGDRAAARRDLAELARLADPSEEAAAAMIAGNLFREEDRLDEAVEAHRRALSLDPPDNVRAAALHGLASVARHRGDLADAEAWMRASLACEPELPTLRPSVRSSYGVLLFELGRADEACTQLELALEEVAPLHHVDAVTARLLVNLGILENERGRRREAARHLARSLAPHRRSGSARRWDVLVTLAAVLIELGELDEAARRLVEAEEEAGGDAEASVAIDLGRGVIGALDGTGAGRSEARGVLERLRALQPDAPTTAQFATLVDPERHPWSGEERPVGGTGRWLGRLLRARQKDRGSPDS